VAKAKAHAALIRNFVTDFMSVGEWGLGVGRHASWETHNSVTMVRRNTSSPMMVNA
jgi:hypothetical protein